MDNYTPMDYMSHAHLCLGDWVYYETPNGTKKYGRICELGSETAGIEEENCRTGIDYEDVACIPIEPDVLEAFGFKEGVMNNIAQPCWIIGWVENDTQTSIEVWPEKFQDTGGKDWICRIGRQLNHCQTQVKNINDIQHAMRVAGITKELEYKDGNAIQIS